MMITIVPYNPRWSEEFATIARSLRAGLGEKALRIDHIGSTSVPGLAAKDIIDIQVTILTFAGMDHLIAHMSVLGYVRLFQDGAMDFDHRPPLAQGPNTDWEKLIFVPQASQRRTYVHVRAQGRPNQRYPLLFCEYLRSHAAAVAAYTQVKVHLAQLHPEDLDAYYAIKNPVCDVIIAAAEEWAQLTGWQITSSE